MNYTLKQQSEYLRQRIKVIIRKYTLLSNKDEYKLFSDYKLDGFNEIKNLEKKLNHKYKYTIPFSIIASYIMQNCINLRNLVHRDIG